MEIDALVERLRNIGPYPMQAALRAADMIMALKARAEAAEKRVKELEEQARYLGGLHREEWQSQVARAEAAEKQFSDYVERVETGIQHWKARAEAAEKRVKELEQTICGGTFTPAVHRAMARYHTETADLLDRAKLEAKP